MTPAARSRWGELKSLLEQGGGIVGELYARTARTLLKRLETIQDREAQRRFRRHATLGSPSPSATAGATSKVESSPSAPKMRV